MKSLKERAKEFTILLPFMEGKNKDEVDNIKGTTVTINEYGFIKSAEDNKPDFVAFTIKEDPKCFYFGGQVLTDQLKQLDDEGYREEIEKDGLPVRFGEKKSANGRKYTTVEFYPAE